MKKLKFIKIFWVVYAIVISFLWAFNAIGFELSVIALLMSIVNIAFNNKVEE